MPHTWMPAILRKPPSCVCGPSVCLLGETLAYAYACLHSAYLAESHVKPANICCGCSLQYKGTTCYGCMGKIQTRLGAICTYARRLPWTDKIWLPFVNCCAPVVFLHITVLDCNTVWFDSKVVASRLFPTNCRMWALSSFLRSNIVFLRNREEDREEVKQRRES